VWECDLNGNIILYGIMAVIFGVIMISPFSGWLSYGSYSGRYLTAAGLGFITGGVGMILYGLVTNPKQKYLIPLEVLESERAKRNSNGAQCSMAEGSEKEAEEKSAIQPATCPHCGHEILKEAKFCPQCGRKPAVVNYCPQCGNKVEKDEKYCPTCGGDLGRAKPTPPATTTVAATLPPEPKRPVGITIMCILWLLGGLYNFFTGLSGLSIDLDSLVKLSQGFYYTDQAVNAWASWAIPAETILMFIGTVLGIMQFATIYGFWNRKDWSHRSGIAVPIVAVITSWSGMFLFLTAPPTLNLTVNYLIPFTNIFVAVIYTAYLRQVHVKKWLRVYKEESLE